MTLIALKHQRLVDKHVFKTTFLYNQQSGKRLHHGNGKTGKHHDFQFKHFLGINNLGCP